MAKSVSECRGRRRSGLSPTVVAAFRTSDDPRPEREEPFFLSNGGPLTVWSRRLVENWKDPSTGKWVRTFAVLTTTAHELVAEIHDRMPVLLPPAAYDRWLGLEPDPRDLLKPFPAERMTMWPVSTRVNTPKNDDEDLIRPVRLPDEPDGDHWNVPRASGTGSESGPVNSE